MVVCIVALVVFAVLGVFSVRYRRIAKDAFVCVKRMLLFKPCEVRLEQKIRSKVTAKLMRAPRVARFFYQHFKTLSWAFTIIFFASLAYSAYGVFNLVVYGTCQPGAPPSACVINQTAPQLVDILTCNEAKVVYAIIAVALFIGLLARYMRRR